mgnify:CR=1 FL=1
MANEVFRIVEFVGEPGRVFRCSDMGTDCQFAVQSTSDEQIVKSVFEHVKRDSFLPGSAHFAAPGGMKMDEGDADTEKLDTPEVYSERAKGFVQNAVHRRKITALPDDMFVFDAVDVLEGVKANGRKVVCVRKQNNIDWFSAVIEEQDRLGARKQYAFATDLEHLVRDTEIAGTLGRSEYIKDLEKRVETLERRVFENLPPKGVLTKIDRSK